MGSYQYLRYDPDRQSPDMWLICKNCGQEFSSPEHFNQERRGGECTRCRRKKCVFVIGPNFVLKVQKKCVNAENIDTPWFGVTARDVYSLLKHTDRSDFNGDDEKYEKLRSHRQEFYNFLVQEGYMSR